MKSYLLCVYACNKYPCVPIQISASLNEALEYIANTCGLTNDEIIKYIRDEFSDSEDYSSDDTKNKVRSQAKYLRDMKAVKYLALDIPIKYFDHFINKDYDEFGKCLHTNFNILIVQTSKDGTFRKNYNEAYSSVHF